MSKARRLRRRLDPTRASICRTSEFSRRGGLGGQMESATERPGELDPRIDQELAIWWKNREDLSREFPALLAGQVPLAQLDQPHAAGDRVSDRSQKITTGEPTTIRHQHQLREHIRELSIDILTARVCRIGPAPLGGCGRRLDT